MKALLILIIFFMTLFTRNINAQVSKEEFLKSSLTPKSNIVVPIGNESEVKAAEISFDNKYLATSCVSSPKIIIWDISTGKQIKEIDFGKNNENWYLINYKFSPNNTNLIIGYQNLSTFGIIVYDLINDKYFNFKTDCSEFIIEPNKNEIILPYNKEIMVYSLDSFNLIKLIKNLNGINKNIITISSDRKYLIGTEHIGHEDKYIIWDYGKGNVIAEINQNKYPDTKKGKSFILGYQPVVHYLNNSSVLLNYDNGEFSVWDIVNKKETWQMPSAHISIETETAVSKDGKYLVTTTKGDKTIKLWDLNDHSGSGIPKDFLLLKDTPEEIYFSNDSIINCVIKEGVIKINVNTWSIYTDQQALTRFKEDNEKFKTDDKLIGPYGFPVSENGNLMYNFLETFIAVKQNFIITSSKQGTVYLYQRDSKYNLNTLLVDPFQQFNSNHSAPNNIICNDNDIFICREKSITKYNLLTGQESIKYIIKDEEEEEEIDSVLVLKGPSKFIAIQYINQTKYFAIAKFQDSKYKVVFQPTNPKDSFYVYKPTPVFYTYKKRYHDSEESIKWYLYNKGEDTTKKSIDNNRTHELIINKLELSPKGNYLIIKWGDGLNSELVTQIIDNKTAKLISSFDGAFYSFDSDEKFIAISIRDKGIEIRNLDNYEIREIPANGVARIVFSKDSKYLFYSSLNSNFNPVSKTISIEDFTKTETSRKISRKIFLNYHERNGILELCEFGNSGKIIVLKDFSKLIPFGRLIDLNEADSLIFIIKNYTIHVFNIYTLEELYTLIGHTNEIKNVFISADKKQIVSYSADKTIKFWDYNNGNLLYTKADFKEGTIYYDKNYRYCGDIKICDSIYYVSGLEIIDLKQVKESLYQPNLVQRILNGENLDHLIKLNDLEISNVSPLVEFIDKKDGSYNYHIIPRKGNVGDIEIYINRIIRLTINSSSLKLINGIYEIIVPEDLINKYRIQGEPLSISIIAKTIKDGIASREAKTIISENYNGITFRKPEIYAIMIGIDNYKGEGLDLNYCSKDAIDLQKAMELSAKKVFNFDGINRVHFFNLINKKDGSIFGITPDRNNILKTIDSVIAYSKPDDIFLIFFAGHGALLENKLTLLTSEASREQAPNYIGITTQELLNKMINVKAGKRILFLDACHSGAAINDLGINTLVGKRDTDDLNEKSQREKELDRIASKSGLAIITASSSDQLANELPQYEHGLLTYSLLTTMLNEPNSLDKENQLQLEYWLRETEKMVTTLGKNQSTQKFVPLNFTIGKVDDEVRKLIVLHEIPTLFLESVININLGADDIRLGVELRSKLNKLSYQGIDKKVLIEERVTSTANLLRVLYTLNHNEINCTLILLKNEVIQKKIELNGQNSKEGINVLALKIIDIVLKNLF